MFQKGSIDELVSIVLIKSYYQRVLEIEHDFEWQEQQTGSSIWEEFSLLTF